MFTNSHQHATNGSSTARRLAAGLTAAALASGFALVGASSAQAADSPFVASSQATFLSGSLLGTNLDNVAQLQAATAQVRPGDAPVTVKDPFKATALKAINVGNGSTINANLGQFLQLGAIGEYATAKNDGTSMAQTGAVGPDGGVTVGSDSAGPGGDATLDLTKLLGTGFASNIASLQLAINAVAAKAVSDGTNASGDYSLAGADLNLTSPAISQLTEKVNTALDGVTSRLSRLDGANGILAGNLNNALIKLNPALNLLGANAHLTATINTGDLRQLVQSLLQAQYGNDGVAFNLETGVVTLNLEKLLGKNLNELAPGTELINASVLNPVLNSVTTKVSGIADQVVDRVKAALNDATVTVHADLSENVAQAPLVKNVCQIVQKVIQVPTQVVQQITIQVPVVNGVPLPVVNGVPQLNGLPVVGGLLGQITGTLSYVTQTVNQTVTKLVDQTVDQSVCSNVSTPLPALNTSVTADLTGTVHNFIQGTGVTAKATAQVLGVSIPSVNLKLAIGDMGNALSTQLLGSNSAITDLVTALDTGLVNPAVQGLTGNAGSVGLLSKVLSVTANNQEISDGTFTETAVRVRVLPTAGSGVAQINLARASVGPNVTGTVGGVDTNPPTDGNPTTPGSPATTAASIARLATTGMGIAALVAAVLALLAAGAYLVRESYRRNHVAMAQ